MASDANSVDSATSSTYSISATHERIYVAWINSQLRKAGCAQISKLQECADGVALHSLMETLGGEKLAITDALGRPVAELRCHCSNDSSSKSDRNLAGEKCGGCDCEKLRELKLRRVEVVLTAMHNRKIRMSPVNAVDVVNCDQRAIMRVVLALAAHFKPTTSRMQNSSVSLSPSSVGLSTNPSGISNSSGSILANVKRDRTWQSLYDSSSRTQQSDEEPLSKRCDVEAGLNTRFERSVTFDGGQALLRPDEESLDGQEVMFSFSRYAKMSDAEKLNSATRRNSTKRQEWLEQRRRRNLSGSSSISPGVDGPPQPLSFDCAADVKNSQSEQDHRVPAETGANSNTNNDDGNASKVMEVGAVTLNGVRETRALLTKLQRTILLNRIVSDADADADVDVDDEIPHNGANSTDAHLKTVDADCVILRSRLDVSLAKQRDLAKCLQQARTANSNLVRANTALRIRLGDPDAEAETNSAEIVDPTGLRDEKSSQRIAQLESEVLSLRNELKARDRVIADLLARSQTTCSAQNGHETENESEQRMVDEVDELSALMSRSLSAYSPSEEHASRGFEGLTLPLEREMKNCHSQSKQAPSKDAAFNKVGNEEDEIL